MTGARSSARRGLGVLLVTTACASGEPEPGAAQRPIVRDSAGVRIVETSATEPMRAPWGLARGPTTSIGALDGDPSAILAGVEGALRLADGAIVVANRQTNEIRVYEPDGHLRRALGGEGEGPGEYTYIRALRRCHGDGFVGFDLNWQMNRYDASATFVDKRVLILGDGITPYNLACDGHGHVVVVGWGEDWRSEPTNELVQARDRVVRLGPDGEVVTDFGTWVASERLVRATGSGPHPFGRSVKFDLRDDFLFIGDGTGLEVQVWTLDGVLRAILRGPPDDGRITEEAKNAWAEAWLARMREDVRPRGRQQLATMPWPERAPSFDRLVVDGQGVVWLRRFAAQGTVTEETWALLSPSAGYLGELRLPEHTELLEPGDDYVLLVHRDELDVERVLLLALERGSRP